MNIRENKLKYFQKYGKLFPKNPVYTIYDNKVSKKQSNHPLLEIIIG